MNGLCDPLRSSLMISIDVIGLVLLISFLIIVIIWILVYLWFFFYLFINILFFKIFYKPCYFFKKNFNMLKNKKPPFFPEVEPNLSKILDIDEENLLHDRYKWSNSAGFQLQCLSTSSSNRLPTENPILTIFLG